MRFLFLLLFPLLISSCNKGFNKALKSKDPAYKLRMAEQQYAKKKYLQAQQLYEEVIPYYRGRPEFEDLYYKYAYTAYNQRDWMNAENLFKSYLEVFPNSNRAEEMAYMRAYTYYKQSPKAPLDQTSTLRAIGALQDFINEHPTSARNKEATAIIDELRIKLEGKDAQAAQLYYDIGQVRAAHVAFLALISNYPDTQHADKYTYWAIKSYLRYAELSVEERKGERFAKVVEDANAFLEEFPQSEWAKQVREIITLSQNQLKISNDQIKA